MAALTLQEATKQLHAAAINFARALLANEPKAGWDELQAMESAAINFAKAQAKPKRRR